MPNLHQKQPKIATIVNVTLTGVRSREIPAPPSLRLHTRALPTPLPGCSPCTDVSVPPAPGTHCPCRALPTALPRPPGRACLLQIGPDAFGGDAASDAESAERGAAPGTHLWGSGEPRHGAFPQHTNSPAGPEEPSDPPAPPHAQALHIPAQGARFAVKFLETGRNSGEKSPGKAASLAQLCPTARPAQAGPSLSLPLSRLHLTQLIPTNRLHLGAVMTISARCRRAAAAD